MLRFGSASFLAARQHYAPGFGIDLLILCSLEQGGDGGGTQYYTHRSAQVIRWLWSEKAHSAG